MLNKREYRVKVSTLILWTIFIILLFFSGFRWDVGIDWESYMEIGENIALIDRIEPANLAIRYFLFMLGYQDGGYWLWIMAFITLFFFFYTIWKLSVLPVLSAILLVCLGPYFDSLNGVRQFVAISIFVYSWQFIFNRQWIRFVCTLLFGTLFHSSILVGLPSYFFVHKFSRNLLIMACIICIPLSFFADGVLSKLMGLLSQYEVYEESSFIVSNSNILSRLRALFPLFLFMICMRLYDKITCNKRDLIILNLSLVSIFLSLLFPGVVLMIRVGFYFQLAFVFLIPIICKYLTPINRYLFVSFTLVYGFLFLYFTQLSKPVAKIIPFQLDFRLADMDLLNMLFFTYLGILIFISCTQISRKRIKSNA